MTSRKGAQRDTRQLDLEELLAHRPPPPAPQAGAVNFDLTFRNHLSRAIKESPKSRIEIAAEMSAMLFGDAGDGEITKAQIDGWTAPSHEAQGHRFPVAYLPALVQVTGAVWLLSELAARCGCHVTPGSAAILMQVGAIALEDKALKDRKSRLSKQLTPELLAQLINDLKEGRA